jgi:transposase, IS6 family
MSGGDAAPTNQDLNNTIEADHGKRKQLIRPVRGFKTLQTAYATIKGFEVMHALRKGAGLQQSPKTSLQGAKGWRKKPS